MHVTAIIAAGGRGRRLGAAVPKQLLAVGGTPMLELSVRAFVRHPRVDSLVVVLPPELVDDPPAYLADTGKPTRLVTGGERRQDSVANGLAAAPDVSEVVLVHDAARPFVDAAVIDRVIDAATSTGAAICALQARDTVKVADQQDAAVVRHTLPRELVFLAQTPQGFRRAVLADAVRLGQAGVEATDEAFLAEQSGHRVTLVEGSARNMKITSAEDLAMAQKMMDEKSEVRSPKSEVEGFERADKLEVRDNAVATMRIGFGYDLHRLVEGRKLIIGGVDIPFERGLHGHSDADVLCHAVTDAVLGAAGAGDIGRHFPDTDERWRGASSVDLLGRAACIVRDAGFEVANVDAVVIADRPKLSPHLPAIVGQLAGALGVPAGVVSVKGKTNEGVGEIGRGEAIACHAVAMLRKNT
jgi:2-C-methyl-D-erythritol 4-phosphate cytidylyltransferase/2-C-methyl-D-erythritol 2,4-cyclodiphosphate synthase